MFIPFLIMLREGLEITLIISLIASFLKRTKKEKLFIDMWKGIIISIFFCFTIGILIDKTSGEFPQKQQELFEAILAVFAVIFMTYMVFWMQNISIKTKLESNINKILVKHNNNSWSLIIIVFLTVSREGLEAIFFLFTTFHQGSGILIFLGAIFGLIVAIFLGFSFYFFNIIINLSIFFKLTSLFILFIAAGLAAGSIRSFHEAGLWNHFQEVVFDLSESSIFSSNNLCGILLESIFGYQESPTISEIIVYFFYLIPMLFIFFIKSKNLINRRI